MVTGVASGVVSGAKGVVSGVTEIVTGGTIGGGNSGTKPIDDGALWDTIPPDGVLPFAWDAPELKNAVSVHLSLRDTSVSQHPTSRAGGSGAGSGAGSSRLGTAGSAGGGAVRRNLSSGSLAAAPSTGAGNSSGGGSGALGRGATGGLPATGTAAALPHSGQHAVKEINIDELNKSAVIKVPLTTMLGDSEGEGHHNIVSRILPLQAVAGAGRCSGSDVHSLLALYVY